MKLFLYTSDITDEEKLSYEKAASEQEVENISFQEIKNAILQGVHEDCETHLREGKKAVIFGDFKDKENNLLLCDATLEVTGVAKNAEGNMLFFTSAGAVTVV